MVCGRLWAGGGAQCVPCHGARRPGSDARVLPFPPLPWPPQLASPSLRRRALGLARGGLRLAPLSDALWAAAGTVAAAAASAEAADALAGAAAAGAPPPAPADALAAAPSAGPAELCLSRALHLNPRRAGCWVALARLYAAAGRPGLASRCLVRSWGPGGGAGAEPPPSPAPEPCAPAPGLQCPRVCAALRGRGWPSSAQDSARSHEPTLSAAWEAMGDAALRRGWRGGPAFAFAASSASPAAACLLEPGCLREAMDAFEHADGLGGDAESRLGRVLGAARRGAASEAKACGSGKWEWQWQGAGRARS
jgi:hypothetical protein